MFIEINDIITGTTITEPLNVYSINYIYGRQDDNVYHLIYVLNNGIRKMEEFATQQELEDRIAEVKDINGVGASVYIYRGSCTFQQLPTSDNEVGDVWNITNDFTLDGKDYPAGTNVAWDGTNWDALAGSIDLSIYYTKEEVDAICDTKITQCSTVPQATEDDYGKVIEYTGATNNTYTSNLFYKCMRTPVPGGALTPLTEEQAVEGITEITLPKTFKLDTIPPVEDNDIVVLLSDGGSSSIRAIATMNSDVHAIEIYITGNTSGVSPEDIPIGYHAVDGLNYSASSVPAEGIRCTFNTTLTLQNTWNNFVGPVLLQPGEFTYSWENINVQDLITNSDIDNLFDNRFTLLLGYSDTIAAGGEHAICIATSGLTFPAANFDDVYPYYIPRSSSFAVSASYNDVTVNVPYTDLRVVQETQDIGFQGDSMLPIIAETGGSLMGVSFTFHIPQDQVYLNGVGNREKDLTFVYPEPIDGSVYPNN